jgi:lauroyl/myristoyl acyltransferase
MGTSRWGSNAAFALARFLPRRWAYRLGETLFDRVASQPELPFTRALRANLAAVLRVAEGSRDVDQGVRRALRNACRSYVDFARASKAGCWAVARRCRAPGAIADSLDDALGARRGVVLAGAHTCSFDFMLTVVGQRFPDVVFLTKPNPKGSSDVMNRIRGDFGLDLSPISPAALREAVGRLRDGGIVVIAADVPAAGAAGLTFFGRPCALSDGFARIALAADAELMVGLSHRLGDDEYEGFAEFVPPPSSGLGRQATARRWAQRALFQLERLIERYPEDWLMPQPLWPQPGEIRRPGHREAEASHPSWGIGADLVRNPKGSRP